MKNYVYVLKSLKDNGYYIGVTHNVTLRFQNHNTGFVRSTRHRRPMKVVYTEIFETKHEALLRERFLKKQKGGDVFKRIIGKINHVAG